MNQPEFDIAVIGAGVVGVASACLLQQAGQRVLLIDKEPPGQGCSKGNAGHFATEQVLPLATPGLLTKIPGMLIDPLGPVAIRWPYLHRITPWMIRFLLNTRKKPYQAGAKAIQQLNEQSLDCWQRLLKMAGASEQLKIDGSLLVFERSDSFLGYQSTLEQIRHYGVNAKVLNGDEARELEPALSPAVEHAVLFPETGHTSDPYKLTLSLLEFFRQCGGVVMQQEVQQLRTKGSGCEVTLSDKTLEVPKVLLATGAWSKKLLQQLSGVSVPLDTERGYHLMLPQAADKLQIPISSADRKFIMTPMDEGLRLAGTVEFGGLEAPANMQRAEMLLKHAKALIPGVSEEMGERWMGFRPSLPDSLPVIDRIGSHGQFLLAFGHQHLGLTQAAVTAEAVLALHQQRSGPVNLQPYRLSRFQ